MTPSVSLTGGRVLTPEGDLVTADVHIAGGAIVEAPGADADCIDCRDRYVLPGIVDVHGDAFEMELHPRPGVDIAFPIAFGSVDRQVLSNGITTAFHGLTLSWEPGARSLDAGRRFMADLAVIGPRLVADHRVQLRWETFAHDAIADIARWLEASPTPALAFNDHTTGTLAAIESGEKRQKLEKWAARAGVSLDAYLALAEAAGARAPDVRAKIGDVAALGRRHGAIMLAHDERTVAERAIHRDLGLHVSEFPLAPEVAADAIANGEHIVMGGPNVIRGGSHNGALGAEETICEGACTILASDYYYPSLFHAVERLVERGVLPLAEAWALVSQNPANAMGLADRGMIAAGRRADLIVIDRSGPWRLVHTIAGGAVASFGR